MWNEQKQPLQSQLALNEQLLWFGQPRSGIVFRASDVFVIPFSLLWGGFAIFWEVGVLTSGAPLFFKLWGVPFVVIGLYLIFGRFIIDAKQRSKTYYGVTNERVIIISSLFGKKIKSLDLRTLNEISLDEKSDGSGTITFGPAPVRYQWFGGIQSPSRGQQSVPAFEMIQKAKSVYETVRSAQRQAALR
jgi:hypothetical protein